MLQERLVRHGSVELSVRVSGRSGPDVVLIHGYGTNLETWEPLRALLEVDCRVIAYDRRGHGRSWGGSAFALADLTNDLSAVIADLKVCRPVLVGHSVGAWEALQYAAGRNDVAAVICLDQGIACSDAFWQQTYRASSPRIGMDGRFSSDELKSGWSAVVRRNAVEVEPGCFVLRPYGVDRAAIQTGWLSVVEEPYDRISCPVVLMLARRNPGPFHELLKRLGKRRGLVVVDVDSDHDIHLEQPMQVADAIRMRCVHDLC